MTELIQLSTLHNSFDYVENAEKARDSIIEQAVSLLETSYSGLDFKRLYSAWVENPSRNLPYHNNFHQASVALVADRMWSAIHKENRPVERAALIMAAMFHDYRHSGGVKPDTNNIVTALRAIQPLLSSNIENLVYEAVLSTEFPFVRDPVSDVAKVLRDADILACTVCSQTTYYKQYVVGLRKEIETAKGTRISDKEFFTMQMNFLPNVEFFLANDYCPEIVKEYENIIKWNSGWLNDSIADCR